jgi:hypothetical protein
MLHHRSAPPFGLHLCRCYTPIRKIISDPMNTAASYPDTPVRETRESEAEVMTLAFQAGLRQLWREHTLDRYLRGEITRAEAVEAAGIDWVKLAERQREAVVEGVAWGLEM